MKPPLLPLLLSFSCVVHAQSVEDLKREEKALKAAVKELQQATKKEKLKANIAKLRLQLATLKEADK